MPKPPFTDNELEQELELLANNIRTNEYLKTYPNSTLGDYLERIVTCQRELMKRIYDMQRHYHLHVEEFTNARTSLPVYGFKRYGSEKV